MVVLGSYLQLERCPHCNVDKPNLYAQGNTLETKDYLGTNIRFWKMYRCQRCGGVVLATAKQDNQEVRDVYPGTSAVDDCIPERPRSYLGQAMTSLHAPAGAVMLAASAVDAMLKVKGYREGSLYSRIDKAAADHIITEDMAKWAHQVRLDANEQRHADEEVPIPGQDDAYRSIEFASALGQFMFVLPAQIEKGLKESEGTENQ